MPVQTINIGGYSCGVPQHVFGELVALALPTVKHFLSDLYHDATWLKETFDTTGPGPFTFWYGVRYNGTQLTQDPYTAGAWRDVWPEIRIYSIAITCDERGKWEMFISVQGC